MEKEMKLKMSTVENGGGSSGNRAASELFQHIPLANLMREELQNSMDAAINDEVCVNVDIALFNAKINDIPAGKQIHQYFQKCNKHWANMQFNTRMRDQVDAGVRIMSGLYKIPVLRISDHNTTGVHGANPVIRNGIEDEFTPYKNLVLNENVSDKKMGDVGSKGIGKNAAFMCSSATLVFYSSIAEPTEMYPTSEQFFIGVLKTPSCKDGDINYTGFGHVCLDDNTKNHSPLMEAVSLDPNYTRTDPGTDRFIIGFNSFEGRLLKAKDFLVPVVENYMMGLFNNRICVTAMGETLNQETLPEFMEKYKDDISSEAHALYQTLTNPDRVLKYSIVNKDDTTVWIKLDPNFPKRAIISRITGMIVNRMGSFRVPKNFIAAVHTNDREASELLRKMEDAKHDSFDAELITTAKEKALAKDVLSKLRKFVSQNVSELAAVETTDEMDADGLSEYLPLNYVAGNGSLSGKEGKREVITNRVDKIDHTKSSGTGTAKITEITKVTTHDDPLGAIIEGYFPDGRSSFRRSGFGSHNPEEEPYGEEQPASTRERSGHTEWPEKTDEYFAQSGDPTNTKKKAGRKIIKLIPSSLPYRFSLRNGIYTLTLYPKKDYKPCVFQMFLSAEGSPVEASLISASVNGNEAKTARNEIYVGPLERGSEYHVSFRIRNTKLLNLEASYYEI